MSAKTALRFFGVQAPPVDSPAEVKAPASRCELSRKAVMEKASRSVREINELLGCVTRELAEGDLDLADLIVPLP